MADPHVLMVVGPFIALLWWTKSWLIDRVIARWRMLVAGLVSVIGWVFLAFASTRAGATSGTGEILIYGSTALAYFCAFMALVSILGVILGLAMWTDEAVEEASDAAPDSARSLLGD